ncbi:MAG: PAS domain S-box protein [Anaerolineae bacterium]|nr:PAS domain S-box protein [Anaerolineae bacterium]
MREANTGDGPESAGSTARRGPSLPQVRAIPGLTLDSLSKVVSGLPMNACLTDAEGRYLAVSDGYCRTYGYEREELLGRSYLMLVPPEGHEQSVARYARRFSGQAVEPVKTPRIRKDGSRILARPEHQLIVLDDGQRVVLSVVADVSELEEARAALDMSEARYRALAEQSYDAIVMTDDKGIVVNWSLGAERILGIPREQALGAKLAELQAAATPPERRTPETATQIRQLVEGFLAGDPSRWQDTLWEHTIQRPDGSRAIVQTRVFPMQTESKLLVGSITRDVTEARAAEEALRKRARQQTRLLETARYLTGSLDLDVILRRIAEEARELLEAAGSAIYLLEPGGEVLRPMVAIEPPYEKEILATPLDVGRSFTGQAVRLRRGVVFNDAYDSPLGQYIEGTPEDTEERIIAVPFVVDDEVLGAMCLSRPGTPFGEEDLTLAETFATYAATAVKNAHAHEQLRREIEERRRAEAALRDSEAQFRALTEHSTDVITRFDRQLRHLYANPAIATLTGMAPEEVVGRTLGETGYPPELCSQWEEAIEQVFQTGRPHLEHLELRGVDGPVYLDLRLVPEFGPEGEVTTVLSSARDITEARRVATALQESERFLSTLMGNLPGAVYRCANDPHWTMIYLSEGSRRLTGYAPEELVANWTIAYADLIHPDDREEVRRQVDAGLAADGTFQLEYRIIARDGQEKWVWERGRLAWSDGDQSVLEGFLTDITERKRARQTQEAMYAISQAALTCGTVEELCASIHETIRQLMPALNLYVALYDPGSDSVSFPYFVDEQEGPPQAPRRGHRGVTEYILRTGRTLLADRERIHELNARGEIRATTGIPESYLGLPLRSQGGPPLGVLAVQSYDASVTYSERERDILEFVSSQVALALQRKEAEEAVRQERDFAQSLLSTAQAIVLVLDPEGRVVSYNSYTEALTGCPLERAKGQEWAALFVPEREREAVREQIGLVLETGSVHGYVNPVLSAEGRERLVEWHGGRLTDAQGNAVGVLTTGHDITERKRLEEQLLQSQKMETIGRLAGGIAHDFNNLLTAITGHAQFALEGLPAGDPTRDDLSEVLRAADRAAGLTRQLLAFSRRQIIEPRLVDLSELVLHTHKMLRRLIGEDIELITVPAPEPCVVRVDPVQIEQVLVNLVVNAGEAMPEGGRLAIEVTPISLDSNYARRYVDLDPGEYVQLSVTDTGTGMSDEVKAHLFEPFYTTKGPDKGTGLGLATVYGIVRQHRGAVSIYSEVGVGTTVRVYLPRVAEAAERLPRRDEAGFLPAGHETVLIVEDEALVRKVVARALSGQGYRVLEAADGREAIRVAQEHAGPIHLLVTDVVMPQMGGKELADNLRAARPEVSVLYVSGYTDSAIVRGGILEDGTAFLQKPFTVAALARKAREVLDARG